MFHLYLRLVSVSLRSQMQYRSSFLLDAISVAGGTLLEFVTLAAVFGRFGSVGGWGLWEVAFLYGLTETAFATMDMVFSGYDPDDFSNTVQRGLLDQMLLRPLSLPVQIFGKDFILRRVGRVTQGVFVFGLSLWFNPLHWTADKLLYLPVVLVSAIAFYGGLFVTGATLCFWTVQRLEAINIFTYGGTTMLSYPMHIYGEWMRRFFTYIVPGALLIYHPALYFLDKPDPLGLPSCMSFLAPVAGFGVLAASFVFWSFGVRKYTSTGT
jgi:ABC-2 type transport system permease protein